MLHIDRDELLRMATQLLISGFDANVSTDRYTDAVAGARLLYAAVDAVCGTPEPEHSPECGTAYRGCAPDCEFAKAQEPDPVRVKPEPVAWRNKQTGRLRASNPIDSLVLICDDWTPLYEPEDA